MAGYKMISHHHFHPTNGVSPADSYGVNRGEFRMHPRSKSFGCTTFSNNQWYDDWQNLVLQTSTQKISGTDIFAYGKVRVIE